MGNSHKMLVSVNIKVFGVDKNVKHDFTLSPSNTNDWTIGIKTDEVVYEALMRSFSINWPYAFFRGMYSYVSTTDSAWSYTGGKSTGAITLNYPIGAAGGIDGICLGTGSRSSSFYIYDLEKEIPNTKLIRGGTTWVAPYLSGSTYEFATYRTFTATENFTITEMKWCGDFTNRRMYTYETIDVSGSTINVSLPSGSTATAWLRFNIDANGPLTKNYLYSFYSYMNNTSVTYTSTTSASATQNFYSDWKKHYINNGAGSDVYGIVIGTDTSSFSVEDYQLYDKITHGTGAGQLSYLSTGFLKGYTVGLPTPDSHSFSETVYRDFINLTGGPVTIGECGIYSLGSITGTEDNNKFLLARNPFPAHIVLQHREGIHVSYTLEFTA